MTQPASVANHRDRSEVHILGLSGSTRKGSFNTALLHAAKDMLPEDTTLEIQNLSGLPLFSQDLERDLMGKPATNRQNMEGQTCWNNQRLIRTKRRREITNASQTDNGRHRHVPDQYSTVTRRRRRDKI